MALVLVVLVLCVTPPLGVFDSDFRNIPASFGFCNINDDDDSVSSVSYAIGLRFSVRPDVGSLKPATFFCLCGPRCMQSLASALRC